MYSVRPRVRTGGFSWWFSGKAFSSIWNGVWITFIAGAWSRSRGTSFTLFICFKQYLVSSFMYDIICSLCCTQRESLVRGRIMWSNVPFLSSLRKVRRSAWWTHYRTWPRCVTLVDFTWIMTEMACRGTRSSFPMRIMWPYRCTVSWYWLLWHIFPAFSLCTVTCYPNGIVLTPTAIQNWIESFFKINTNCYHSKEKSLADSLLSSSSRLMYRDSTSINAMMKQTPPMHTIIITSSKLSSTIDFVPTVASFIKFLVEMVLI